MKKKIAPLIKGCHKNPSILFAYLFGSKVKDYANEKSDWDVAVYFAEPMERNKTWLAFELEAELSKVVGAVVQVVVLNEPIPPVFGFEIVKDGVVLLDRDKNFRMDFENRTLRDYHDWQYYLKRQLKAEGHSSDDFITR